MKKVIEDLDLKFFCCPLNDEIIDLRHKILRPGQLRSSAIFGDDLVNTTLHFVARASRAPDAPVCCVSYFFKEYEGFLAYQVRGMATATEFQKQGVGKKLLHFAEYFIKDQKGITKFWCNARVEAIGFYESQGWTCSGPEFILPGIGPHRKMIKGITPF